MTLARSTMSKLEERTPTEWPWLWRAVATVLAVSRRLQKTIAWPAPIMPWGKGGFSGTKNSDETWKRVYSMVQKPRQ